jgi:UDPglucose 6-dehydrogenase
VADLYKRVETARDRIAKLAGLKAPAKLPESKYMTVNLESAELIKVVSNAFLALKISFANSIAMLADKAGADITEVVDAVGADQRIGRAFLNAGRGYGGGCFPKDVSGLIAAAQEMGVNLEIVRAGQALNEQMPGYILEKLQQAAGGSMAGSTVAVLGLAFKAKTSDVRKSPGVAFANRLARAGAEVRAFDPQANEEARESLNRKVTVSKDVAAAVRGANVVIVATDWPEFVSLSPKQYAGWLTGKKIFVDAMNRFDIPAVTKASMLYVGVGRG